MTRELSQATRDKMSQSAMYRSHSLETRNKISVSLKNKTRTPAQRKRYSVAKQGEKSPTAKLTTAEVLEIRQRFKQGTRICALATEYDVTWSNIQSIVLGKSWRHLLPHKKKNA